LLRRRFHDRSEIIKHLQTLSTGTTEVFAN
jgi:hypothetical protein